ncbi:unnamed protein product [Caenorhabditis auriculariae]|uniref:Uncharacterized protein n=1 Tax=Caenorhabditis auriculariae TaxID=2777116 RepID=A0A8S1H6B3_9PELO|nr:unnamed protein product [Caenorhabditis auriculariae]
MTLKDLTPSQIELFDACRQGDYECVRSLLSAKKHKRPRTPLSIFRASSASNHLAALRDPTSTYTTLHYSALKGHEQISKYETF